MKEIAFDSVLLIAADDVSQQAINQLRSDGIYSIENRSCTLINIVVVSTAEGAEHVHQILENHERARKNVVVKMTPELSIKDESDIDSILSFLPEPGCNLLSFTVGKYDEKALSRHLASLNEYMDTFPEESCLYWTYREATPQKVTLFASISSEQ